MPQASSNGIQIEYDSFGDQADPALVLIMGYAAAMDWWDEEFCQLLAGRGFFVVRFDNRDVGRTTHFTGVEPDLEAIMKGDAASRAYTVDDMADDVVGLLDTLGIEQAHIVGASMGGMIAQMVAIRHPDRVLSLTSIMSTPGPLPSPGDPQLAAIGEALADRGGRDATIDHEVELRRMLAGSGHPFDPVRARRCATREWDRDPHHDRGGVRRQLAAMATAGNRHVALAGVRAPVLVLHGADDPVVPVESGEETAAAVPGATLMVLPGVGHELPTQVWPQVADAIAANAARATTARHQLDL
ncbi:alpha/beta hydrolase [Planosporangium thailandense]|uniref:Alpha/beta hydrolase n=1 Tax=Planosporangium thailandense TaxID=765197 RepID=A0ABX0Y618_9ACTN|nr:alpha/beta hydrolase [Planosporangium thailandense]